MATGYVVYIGIGLFFALKNAGLEIIITVPAALLYLTQIVAYILLGYFLLRSISRWSVAAIVASTIVSPLALAMVAAFIAHQFAYTVDLSNPVGVGILIFFLLTPLIMGTIAYNDIRYRLPKVK